MKVIHRIKSELGKLLAIMMVAGAILLLVACQTPAPAADEAPTVAPETPTTAPEAPAVAEETTPVRAGFSDAWEPVSCDAFKLPPDVAGSSDCGYVTVPEHHANPDGPAIQVAVVRTRSIGKTPAPDPLFMEQGGPGSSTIGTWPANILISTPNLLEILKTRDMVFVEQRGTLHSRPNLLCPEKVAHFIGKAEGQFADSDVSYLEACRDRLEGEGVNLDAFNTVENAADIYAVAEALGYEEFNYWGTSYGTMLGQYVMDQASDHTAKLRSTIVDAVVTTDVNFAAFAGSAVSHALRNLFTNCAANEICNRDFPDLETVFFDLVDQLNEQPIPVTLMMPQETLDVVEGAPATIETELDGQDLMRAVQGQLYSNVASQRLPQEIYQSANAGDFGWVIRAMTDNLKPSNSATGMQFAILCSRLDSIAEGKTYLAEPYPQAAFLDTSDDLTQGCEIMGVAPEGEPFAQDNMATPTLVLNGAYDPITPTPYGQAVADQLDTAYVYTFPDTGHGSTYRNPCATAITLTFLADPMTAPDGNCIEAVPPVFIGEITPPDELTLAERTLPNGITIALPSQWALRPSTGTFTDPSDVDNTSKAGSALVSLVPAASIDEAVTALGPHLSVISSDVQLGVFPWTIVEGSLGSAFDERSGVALLPGTGQAVAVRILANPETSDAVFDALLDPILSSVRFGDAQDTSETEAPVEEATIETSPLAALAAQGSTSVVEIMMSECPPGTRTFPVPDAATNAKRPLAIAPFAEAMATMTAEQSAAFDATLTGKTLLEFQAMLESGEITSESLVLYYLNRIQQYDVNRLNSVMELNPEALAIARELDAERAAGARGPLYGIPVLLKDNIGTAAPMHTTAGAYALREWQPSRDAFLVQQLRDAGAIILGKANLSEWANYTDPCMPSGFSALGGQTRNPYGPFDALGSSSGSAVSVAAGLAPVSIGSETSGSLLEPGRANGVVAFRPSQGVISRDYVIPLEANLDTPGPMGHSVTDVAIMLNALAGEDANDSKTADAASLADTDFTHFLSLDEARKVKVGYVLLDATTIQTLFSAGLVTQEQMTAMTNEEFAQYIDAVAPASGGATQAMADALVSQGIKVVPIQQSSVPPMIQGIEPGLLPYGFQDAFNRFMNSLGDEAPVASLAEAAAIANEDPANRAPYGQRYVEGSANTTVTDEQYEQAIADGQRFAADWMQWFKDTYDVDVILMGADYKLAGLGGIPALSIPTGQAPNENGQPGQPLGVFITGPYLSDGQVLAIGYALEQALNVQLRPNLDATIEQILAVTGQQ